MTTSGLRCWADVRLDALRANLAVLRARLPPETTLVAVVKGDAYGHGAVRCAELLRREGVGVFGVATIEEAAELREANFTEPLWHLGLLAPDEAEAAVELGLVPTVTEEALLVALESAARAAAPYPIHLKLDTGMGRRGVGLDGIRRLWQRVRAGGVLHVDGLGTHLATADVDPSFAAIQLDAFDAACRLLAGEGFVARWNHVANSAGVLRFGACGGNAVRPGLCLYGPSGVPLPGGDALRPVLSLHARLVQLRDLPAGHEVGYAHACRLTRPTRVGLASIGYADGLPWQLSRGAEAIVGGLRVPYLGRVNMDMIQLDLNSVPAARVGDTVTLLGRDGAAEITRGELAEWAGTSEYAVTTQLGRRVTRRWWDGERLTATRGLDGRLRREDER